MEENDQLNVYGINDEHSTFKADLPQKPNHRLPAKRLYKENARVDDMNIPRSSIPRSLPQKEFARQCILAAYSSRLNPYALHSGELKLLHSRITYPQVTIYLNIRNAILRLWTRNPLLSVSLEEALGCAKDRRHFGLARIAYYWLFRNGYINFGCVEAAKISTAATKTKNCVSKQQTVIVVGSGMAGLGCARHLTGLFSYFANKFAERDEMPPRIIILEGRSRIGGRIYSHPLRRKMGKGEREGVRPTAEMGAHIITGFDHGNPLNALVRGQLALPYRAIRDNSILFDHDGAHIEKCRDEVIEKLYNDLLERISVYRHRPKQEAVVEGERRYIELSKNPDNEEGSFVTASPVPGNVTTNGQVKAHGHTNGETSKTQTTNELKGKPMKLLMI